MHTFYTISNCADFIWTVFYKYISEPWKCNFCSLRHNFKEPCLNKLIIYCQFVKYFGGPKANTSQKGPTKDNKWRQAFHFLQAMALKIMVTQQVLQWGLPSLSCSAHKQVLNSDIRQLTKFQATIFSNFCQNLLPLIAKSSWPQFSQPVLNKVCEECWENW